MSGPHAEQMSWLAEPITTARLVLREVIADDVPHIRPLWTDSRVRQYLGGPVPGRKERRAVGEAGRFTVVRRQDGAIVGMVLLCRYARTGETEVAYLFLPEHWGHGYAREAVDAALRFGFQWADRIVAIAQEANAPSRRLLEALGMSLRERFIEHGILQMLYALERLAQPERNSHQGNPASRPHGAPVS